MYCFFQINVNPIQAGGLRGGHSGWGGVNLPPPIYLKNQKSCDVETLHNIRLTFLVFKNKICLTIPIVILMTSSFQSYESAFFLFFGVFWEIMYFGKLKSCFQKIFDLLVVNKLFI